MKVANLPLRATDCVTSIMPRKLTVAPAGMVVEEPTSILSIEICLPKPSACRSVGIKKVTIRQRYLNIWFTVFPNFSRFRSWRYKIRWW